MLMHLIVAWELQNSLNILRSKNVINQKNIVVKKKKTKLISTKNKYIQKCHR